ncbi:unnamed protein product [Acanthocheilonema viteae]|uniref:Uncharacterized protein n=1 Tax=Acanthocheilonema viteae TaxID=6277 RepID=A0A498SLT4_ACAVI|nr:unnamed protein product [Acanthocheilonema viteae]
MISYFTPIFLPHNLPVFILLLLYYFQSGTVIVEAIRCYSCANDFIVWHWRHFFLKRNYGITASDQSCAKSDYTPEITQLCPSTCFIMYLNGTNRGNGMITVLGTVRGCSSQFLTSDQHSQLGLGSHSRVSQIGNYLSSEFDMSIGASVPLINAMKKVATVENHIPNSRQNDISTSSTNIFPQMLPIEPL